MSFTDAPLMRSQMSSKRKLEDPTASFAHRPSNKSAKLNSSSSPNGNFKNDLVNGNKNASVGDEEPDVDDDAEAGPELPPEEAEDELDEDEEGRFFGGGVSKQERDVIDFIAENEVDETEEKIDISWLKRTALNFERKINKNAELRAKFENEPMKFVASEADLDTEIKNLSILSEHTSLYEDFVRSGCVSSLTNLLAHENTDIAIAVCEVIAELTDEDTGANETQWNALTRELLRDDIAELLVSNLKRLDENNENDKSGVYHILTVMENLLSGADNAEKLGRNPELLTWLISRIKTPDMDVSTKVGQNRAYAAEVLSILVQSNTKNRDRLSKAEGVDLLLQQLSVWRRKDPEKDSDEEGFAENLFDGLISTVKEPLGAEKFLEAEGVELCIIFLRESKFCKSAAIRLLDHVAGGPQGSAVSVRIIEAGGLKPIFTSFMKYKKAERDQLEHLVGLFASMLRHLPGESAPRIRLLAKFVEKDYEKISRLMELRNEYVSKLTMVEANIEKERKAMTQAEMTEMEEEWLSRRMDAGSFSIQTIDVVLAWLIAEDGGAKRKVTNLNGGIDLNKIKMSLQEQLDGIDIEATEESSSAREMLQALLSCL